MYLYYTEYSSRDSKILKVFVCPHVFLTPQIFYQSPGRSLLSCTYSIYNPLVDCSCADNITIYRAVDTLQIVLLGYMYYTYTVTNFGDYIYLSETHW